jgi:predicted DNA-binding transcriptional regulator YafY
MKALGPKWKRQQWTVARAAAVLAAAVKKGRRPSFAEMQRRFGIGLRELMHLNARLGINDDMNGTTQLRLELHFEDGGVRAIGADRLSQLTRLSRVQAAFAAQALEQLAVQGPTKAFATGLAGRLKAAAGQVDDQLLIYRPSDPERLRAKVALLHAALQQQQTVAFEYRGPASKSAGRVVDPLSLRRDQGVWRLLGFDQHRQALRVFKLEHLTKLVITAHPFTWPKGLKPDEVKSRDLSVYAPSGKETAVKLKVSARLAEDWKSVFKTLGKPDKAGCR